MRLTHANSSLRLAVILAALVLCSGCEARQLGVNFADKQASAVDPSWVAAVKACWPDLADPAYTTEGLKRYLADPLHVRAAFSTYSTLDDAALRSIVTRPLSAAPPPDSSVLDHSQTAVLTRYQISTGVNPSTAAAANTDSAAPPDALCAVHPGTPIGFK